MVSGCIRHSVDVYQPIVSSDKTGTIKPNCIRLLCPWSAILYFCIVDASLTVLDPGSPILGYYWSRGFGFVGRNYKIPGTNDQPVIGNIFIANSLQLLLSIIYVSYNTLLTSLLVSREFAVFGSKRTGLRVTSPSHRFQKSTYWLSLPYRFSISLLIMSILLHWSLSQSLLAILVEIVQINGEP